jgi:hypothetical protein
MTRDFLSQVIVPSGMTYAQGLAKQNLETAVSNINSTYTEILKMIRLMIKESELIVVNKELT